MDRPWPMMPRICRPEGEGFAPYSRIVIVDLDLTELRANQRSLEGAVEAKDRMAATMAHELRNPVTSPVDSAPSRLGLEDLGDEARREMATSSRRYGGRRRVLRVVTGDRDVWVHVRDHGEGLPDDLVDRLFQPLANGGSSGSLGLGLSVSRDLARAMGGDLSFDRREGWTQFELALRAPGID